MNDDFYKLIEDYGCLNSPYDSRDYKIISKNTTYPKEYLLSMPHLKNQSMIRSCVGHSLAYINEYFYRKESNKDSDFSAGFIYGYRPEGYSQDKGMYIREGLQTLINIGNVPDYEFPYNEEMPKIKTMVEEKLQQLLSVAKQYKISKYAKLDGINQIKTCLMNNIPVVMSIPIYKKAFKNNFNGMIEKPQANDTQNGNHAIAIFGWKTINDKEYLIVLNSWGLFWGNQGKANLSIEYPINEAWGIVDDKNSPLIVKPKYFWLFDLFYKLKKLC
jgi:C1A family cysteine protease